MRREWPVGRVITVPLVSMDTSGPQAHRDRLERAAPRELLVKLAAWA